MRALNETGGYKTVAFIDANPSLAGQLVHGVKVLRPEKIGKVIADENVKEVLLATPSALRGERRIALKVLEAFPVVVKTLPALEEIASGHVQVSDLRPIDVEDLLGPRSGHAQSRAACRQRAGQGGDDHRRRRLDRLGADAPAAQARAEDARAVRAVGGRALRYLDGDRGPQARVCKKKRRAAPPSPPTIVAVLGSVLDRKLVARTIQERGVEVIYHAAAYKHVPIVEMNPFAGLQNNTFGTLVVAEVAKELGVERFVLVSSDKAVRPTNIMGASKRLAEQILQALAQERGTATIFTMVRFGNVLDSSGSVVKLFRTQIKAGGPVTVTHPEVIRYFMSIPGGGAARHPGGHHGDRRRGVRAGDGHAGQDRRSRPHHDPPVRASRCATRSIPTATSPSTMSGLRPGEKLYEELLIGENTTGTSHPRIFKNSEPIVPFEDLVAVLERLEDAIQRLDEAEMQELLRATVEGYVPASSGHPDRRQGRVAARLAHASLERMAASLSPRCGPSCWWRDAPGLSALLILMLKPLARAPSAGAPECALLAHDPHPARRGARGDVVDFCRLRARASRLGAGA